MAKMVKKAQDGGFLEKIKKSAASDSSRKTGLTPAKVSKDIDKIAKKDTTTYKKAKNGSSFGMLSVKAGVDKNPNPTAADRIAGAKGMAKKGKSVAKKMMKNGGTLSAPTKGGVSMQLGSYTKTIGKNYTGKNVVNKGAKAKMGKSMGKCKYGC